MPPLADRIVHANIAVEIHAHRENLRGKGTGAEVVVPGGQRIAEEVQAIGDGGAEGQDDARNRQAAAVVNLQAVALHVGVVAGGRRTRPCCSTCCQLLSPSVVARMR